MAKDGAPITAQSVPAAIAIHNEPTNPVVTKSVGTNPVATHLWGAIYIATYMLGKIKILVSYRSREVCANKNQ